MKYIILSFILYPSEFLMNTINDKNDNKLIKGVIKN